MIAPPKPPPDELEALIKEARARQLRRRLLGAAGVAIVAAGGLSLYALVGGGGPSALTQPPANAGRVTGPRCRAPQLSASVGFQGATQTLVGGATVTNVSGRSCSLPTTWPRVRIRSNGKRLPVVERRPAESRRFSEKPARVLAPGAVAVLEMQWADWCGRRSLPNERFVIHLGPELTITARTVAAPPCFAPRRTSVLIVDRARQQS